MSTRLLSWYQRNKRDLPWRRTSDPYKIWVSEIMLQQTRVAAVIPYYDRFLDKLPTVGDLAQLAEPDLLAMWAGLGYYTRARNLQKAAKQITDLGEFPRAYEAIRELPGVGDYTAAAVASIAFGLPHVVVDGNVLRVMSRLTSDSGDIKTPATKERLREAAASLLPHKHPGEFNQALMELGATVCLPKEPLCSKCPVATFCKGLQQGKQRELPIKRAARDTVAIEQTLLWIERRGKLLLRPSEKVSGFWDLPEASELTDACVGDELGQFRHSITHHRYLFTVVTGSVNSTPKPLEWLTINDLGRIPLSTIAKKALKIVR